MSAFSHADKKWRRSVRQLWRERPCQVAATASPDIRLEHRCMSDTAEDSPAMAALLLNSPRGDPHQHFVVRQHRQLLALQGRVNTAQASSQTFVVPDSFSGRKHGTRREPVLERAPYSSWSSV